MSGARFVDSNSNILICSYIRRNDAGLAAAELALAIEKHVLESGSIDTVGTVGKSYFIQFTPKFNTNCTIPFFP